MVTIAAVSHVLSPKRRWRRQLIKETVGKMIFDHANEVPFGRLREGAPLADRFIHILRSELLRTSIPDYSEHIAATAHLDCPVDRYRVIAFDAIHRDQAAQRLSRGQSYFLDFTDFVRVTWMLIQSCHRYPEKKNELFRVYMSELEYCDMPWYELVSRSSGSWARIRRHIPMEIILLITMFIILLLVMVLLVYYGCISQTVC